MSRRPPSRGARGAALIAAEGGGGEGANNTPQRKTRTYLPKYHTCHTSPRRHLPHLPQLCGDNNHQTETLPTSQGYPKPTPGPPRVPTLAT
ncbi:hypothetical protein E2C01_070447 [Portunus trituberculatus]|uniref:Uncharacterized protein n=1 Tax=Portunus trituberculatus TaxID=210409 RepID=A0A5B7I249_PORTR|nr:hypothetical protein [Portunus trituberculatus]